MQEDVAGLSVEGEEEGQVLEQKVAYDFKAVREKKIMQKLEEATECIKELDFEGAIVKF